MLCTPFDVKSAAWAEREPGIYCRIMSPLVETHFFFTVVGSILSNLLLVLGMCFFAGGTRFSEQGLGIGACSERPFSLGSFTVATYWLLILLLISYLFVFYCQLTNK
ncbi:hypothetical protein BGY98DRAFT_164235 [Russula aff. rugulosa BPL654]|nr:hypothetical protein BGY98DRAFT_164235 [Russula aff. rugulosa BPL654]